MDRTPNPESCNNVIKPQAGLVTSDFSLWESKELLTSVLPRVGSEVKEALSLRTFIRNSAVNINGDLSELAKRAQSLQKEGLFLVQPFSDKYFGDERRLWLSRDGLIYGQLADLTGSFGYQIDRAIISERMPIKEVIKWQREGITQEIFSNDLQQAIENFRGMINKAQETVDQEGSYVG